MQMNWQITGIICPKFCLLLEQYFDFFLCINGWNEYSLTRILPNKLSDLDTTLSRLSAHFGVMGIISKINLTGIRSIFKFPFPGLNLLSLNHSLAKNIPTSKCCFTTFRNNYHQKNSSTTESYQQTKATTH